MAPLTFVDIDPEPPVLAYTSPPCAAVLPMTLTRALEINVAILNRAFFSMGFDQTPFGDLTGVTLAQMLEAVRIVDEQNDQEKSVDGHRTLHVIPDQRLIAAVYTLENYEHCISIASAPTTMNGVAGLRCVHAIQTTPAAKGATRANG